MTDLAADADAHHSSGDAAAARRRKRYAADRRLRGFGIAAISFALGLLGVLILTLVMSGYSAFTADLHPGRFPDLDGIRRPGRSGGRQFPARHAGGHLRASARCGEPGGSAGDHRHHDEEHAVLPARRGGCGSGRDRRDAHARRAGLGPLRPAQQGSDRPGNAGRPTSSGPTRRSTAFDALVDAGRITRRFNWALFLERRQPVSGDRRALGRDRRLVLRCCSSVS